MASDVTLVVGESITIQAPTTSGGGSGGVDPPIVIPPGTPPVGSVNLGALSFDSVRHQLDVVGGTFIYVTMVIPDGFSGMHSNWDVYEFIDAQRTRKIYLTKDPNARPVWPAYGEGSSASIAIYFGITATNAVCVQSGEVWYGVIYFERLNGSASLPPGSSCTFATTLSAPSA